MTKDSFIRLAYIKDPISYNSCVKYGDSNSFIIGILHVLISHKETVRIQPAKE